MSGDEAQWVTLEREVASLYRALGYTVERDELLRQSQIDLVATKPLGGAQAARLAIEVKHRSKGLVPIDEVRKFLDTARDLLSEGVISGAVLITNTGFSRGAKARVGDDRRFHLATLEDLRRDLIFNEEHLRRWIRAYEATQVSSRFIDIGLIPQGRHSRPPVAHVTELLESIESRETPASVVLFADYGGGKTTGLERLKYLALKRYLDQKTNRLPIMFQLKLLTDFADLDGFIAHSLQNALAAQCNLETFWELVDEDRFLLLFDGFDEIAVQPTEKERAKFLARIAPLFFASCASILSSRPSYFANQKEYLRLVVRSQAASGLTGPTNPARQILGPKSERLFTELRAGRAQARGDRSALVGECDTYSLAPLDEHQIRDYVTRLADGLATIGIRDPADVLSFLETVYDLSDLVTRPILLQMITATILSGAIDVYAPAENIGPAELYEVYTEMHLVEDFDRGPVRQKGLSTVERREFAERCAWKMNLLGILVLSRLEAETMAHRLVQLRTDTSEYAYRRALEKVMTDLRTCSFLTIDEDGDLRFIHKSFLEFFLASRIREVLLQGKDLSDIARAVPNETLYFLGAMTYSVDNPKARLVYDAMVQALDRTDRPQDGGKGRESLIRTNLLGGLLYGRETIANVNIRGGRAPRVTKQLVRLKDCNFENVSLDELQLSKLTLEDCSLLTCQIGGNVGDLKIGRSRLDLGLGRCQHVELDACAGVVQIRRTSREPVKVLGGSNLRLAATEGTEHLHVDALDSTVCLDGARSVVCSVERCILEVSAPTTRGAFNSRVVANQSVVFLMPNALEQPAVWDVGELSFKGALVDCMILVHPDLPLHVLQDWDMTRCVIAGGCIVHDAAAARDESIIRAALDELSSSVILTFDRGRGDWRPAPTRLILTLEGENPVALDIKKGAKYRQVV